MALGSTEPSTRLNTAFWSSCACDTESPYGRRPPGEVPAPGSVVLVGPRESGKRRFLASLGRAFESRRNPEWTRFVAGKSLTALVAASAAGAESEEAASGSKSGTTYTFQIGLRSAGAGTTAAEKAGEMEVSVLATSDSFFEALAGQGSRKLDQESLDNLIRAARNARCLVLCIGCAETGPHRKLELTAVISRLLGFGPRQLLRVGAKPWPARDSPWERAPRLELPFERVLVLISGIEVVCGEAARRLADLESHWLSAWPADLRNIEAFLHCGMQGIAESLDLWRLAADRVEGLDLLAASLSPGAVLGVCGISTTGLNSSPACRSHLDSPDPGSSIDFGPSGPGPILGATPFGVWSSLLFMTTGLIAPPLVTFDHRSRVAAAQLWTQLREQSGDEP